MGLISILIVLSSNAFAGDNCSEQKRLAVENCQARVLTAKTANVGSAQGDAINDYGTQQMNGFDKTIKALIAASGDCRTKDAKVCEDQCNNSKEEAAIRKDCFDEIQKTIAGAHESIAGLNQAASESATSHNQACQGDCQIDHHSDVAAEYQDQIQKTGSGPQPVSFLDGNGNRQVYYSSTTNLTPTANGSNLIQNMKTLQSISGVAPAIMLPGPGN